MIAAAIMAAAVWFTMGFTETIAGHGAAMFAVKAFVPITVGARTYFAAARLVRLEEASTLLGRFRR